MNKISHINSFFIKEKTYLVTSKNSLTNLNGKELVKVKNDILRTTLFSNFIYIETISLETGLEETLVYSINHKSIIKNEVVKELMLRGEIINKDKIIALKYDASFNTKIGIYSFNQNYHELIIDNDFYISKFYFFDKLYITNNENILFYSLTKNLVLIEKKCSYPDYKNFNDIQCSTHIEKIIGVHENELWILLSNNRFLVLNKDTGEEIYHIRNLAEALKISGLKIEDIHLDKKNGKIKFLAYLFYIEIDIVKKRIDIKAHLGMKHSNQLFIARSRYYDEDVNLYFIGRKGQSNFNIVTGIFNTETCSVSWLYELEVEHEYHFFIDTPKVNHNWFGVLDNKKNLYLFDRLKDMPPG